MKAYLFLQRLVHPLNADEKMHIIQDIRQSSTSSFDFFLLVVLSSSIATLGLITNSPAVIIGAMLVAPLMSPIIGIGLSSITGDSLLARNSATALLRGTGNFAFHFNDDDQLETTLRRLTGTSE